MTHLEWVKARLAYADKDGRIAINARDVKAVIKEVETWREYVEKLPQSERETLFKQ